MNSPRPPARIARQIVGDDHRCFIAKACHGRLDSSMDAFFDYWVVVGYRRGKVSHMIGKRDCLMAPTSSGNVKEASVLDVLPSVSPSEKGYVKNLCLVPYSTQNINSKRMHRLTFTPLSRSFVCHHLLQRSLTKFIAINSLTLGHDSRTLAQRCSPCGPDTTPHRRRFPLHRWLLNGIPLPTPTATTNAGLLRPAPLLTPFHAFKALLLTI